MNYVNICVSARLPAGVNPISVDADNFIIDQGVLILRNGDRNLAAYPAGSWVCVSLQDADEPWPRPGDE